MKFILTIITALFAVSVYGQTTDSKSLLESAKTSFNNRTVVDDDDYVFYSEIISMLTDVLEVDTENTEAMYYLGYAYSRLNSSDGKSMINMNLDLVLKSSEQFEKINKLTPHYEGEVVSLYPYLKLSSEWGSLAMSYLYNNKKDSAVWAFKEGQKRGGFERYVLEFNKMALDACSKNAILVSSGDITTISLWFLQNVEGYRKDVAVVDVNMLNTSWYSDYLSKNKIVAFDLPLQVMDTFDFYTEWSDSLVTIGDFSWIVSPSSYNAYMTRGDRLFMSLLTQNKFKRDLFFTIGIPREQMLSIEDYLSSVVVAGKFVAEKGVEQAYDDYKKSITDILKISEYLNMNNPDEIRLLYYFRLNCLMRINYYLDNKDMAKVKELTEIHDKYGKEDVFPYQNEHQSRIIKNIRYRINLIENRKHRLSEYKGKLACLC